MLMVLSMAQTHLLAQDDENEVQHDCSGYMMPLELVFALLDTNDIKNGTIVFLTLRQLK